MKLINVEIYDGRLPGLIKYCVSKGFSPGYLITIAHRTWWYGLWNLCGKKYFSDPHKIKQYYRLSANLWFDYPSFSALPLYEADKLETLNVDLLMN